MHHHCIAASMHHVKSMTYDDQKHPGIISKCILITGCRIFSPIISQNGGEICGRICYNMLQNMKQMTNGCIYGKIFKIFQQCKHKPHGTQEQKELSLGSTEP